MTNVNDGKSTWDKPAAGSYGLELFAVAALGILAACDSPLTPRPERPTNRITATRAEQQGPLRRDTPWRDMSDAALAAKITDAGGRVFIGFKAAGAGAGVDERGRVLVGASVVADAKSQLRALGVILDFEFIDMPTVVARMPATLLGQVRQNPEVEYVEPIFPGTYTSQDTTWNVRRVQAPAAWSSSTGSGAKLLILDSGIDNTHPDLAPAVIQSCDGTNGLDQFGHGTETAGVAAAVNNDLGIIGAAYGLSLWASKIGASTPDPGYAACGVQFGRINGVAVISMSIGVPPYTALTDQINAAYYQNGIVLVAAAGNNGPAVDYPALHPIS